MAMFAKTKDFPYSDATKPLDYAPYVKKTPTKFVGNAKLQPAQQEDVCFVYIQSRALQYVFGPSSAL